MVRLQTYVHFELQTATVVIVDSIQYAHMRWYTVPDGSRAACCLCVLQA